MPGGTPIWNRRGCASKVWNVTPQGDNLGVAQAFSISIWTWRKQIFTPKETA